MQFHAILNSKTTEKKDRGRKMGSVYDENEELDFTFLKQSVRQQPRGAAARQRAYYRGGERAIPGETERLQRQERRERSGQSQAPQRGQGRTYQQGRPSANRQGQAAVKRPQTMQEKQRQRKAALIARRKRRLRRQKQMLAVSLCILLGGSVFAVYQLRQMGVEAETGEQEMPYVQAEGSSMSWSEELGVIQGIPENKYNQHPNWTEEFLTISEYSRPGEPLTEVNNIFVHYTANQNTSAANNRNYFENLKDNHDVPGASAHFIIGIEGEILQLVPLDEIAYAVQTRNEDSISIECCYKYENGQFTQETYDSLIELLAWLTDAFELEPDDILRHYDCGGKKCPLYYVENEDAWRILKKDVGDRITSMQ